MLSFGYTLLTREAVTALEIAGLDPAVGLLHDLQRGRPSLALDLIEEFRPVVVDSVVTRLCDSGKITPAGFGIQGHPETSCRMTRETLKLFLATYERRMLTSPITPTPVAARPTVPLSPSRPASLHGSSPSACTSST
jgi:CRISPR-associated protein Cas1